MPGYNGLPNIKMEDGMPTTLGGMKVSTAALQHCSTAALQWLVL